MKSSQMLKGIILIIFLILGNSCATQQAVMPTPVSDPPAPVMKASIIQRIAFVEEENYTKILIEGSDNISPPIYKLLDSPLRIVLDVPNIDLKQVKEPLQVNNGTVGVILSTQYDDKGRIEISLSERTNYNISNENKNLIIDIEKIKRTAEVKEEKKQEETVEGKGPEPSPEELNKEETLSPQPVVAASPPEPVNKAKEVINFSLNEKKDFVTFNIIADGKLENYNSFKLESPTRLVLDILEVTTRYPQKSVKIKNPYIKEVRIGQYPDKVRLVFDSLKPQLPTYQINRIADQLIVSVGNVPQPYEPQILIQEKTPEAPSPLNAQKDSNASLKVQAKNLSSLPAEPTKTVKANSLTAIDFKQMDHKSRIVVTFIEDPKFETHRMPGKTIAVDIKNGFVAKNLQRRLDTREFESAVDYIDLQNIKNGKVNDVRISIKLKEEIPFEATQEGKTLFIDIESPKKNEAKLETALTSKKDEGMGEAKKEEVRKDEEKSIPEAKIVEKGGTPVEEKPLLQPPVAQKVEEEKNTEERRTIQEPPVGRIYTGRKLSLDFKDADIKNVLRLIAEVSNLNIIAGDDVAGKITMRLVDIPWDQALDIILQTRNLGKNQVGNVMRIAPIETMKREVQADLEARRARERLEDLRTELITLNYATAKDMLLWVKSILSDRGDVRFDERTNTLVVKDIPKRIPDVIKFVKALDTKTPQVLIEARIVEANLVFQRELGVSWGFLATKGGDTSKSTTNVGGGTGGTSGLLGTALNNVVNLPATPRGGAGGSGGSTAGNAGILEFLFTSSYGLRELDVAISAHENRNNAKVVSSPKIATLNNKEASIEQGLRIPYLKLTTEGTVTTDFIDANLKLTVTPHVTNDGNIKMIVKVKKDAPDTTITVQGVPSIDKKEAISEVLIKDNGVVVIAGIYTIDKNEQTEGVPLFSKIPLLGWLFKRENKADTRKDLLIFISPKILKDEI